MAFSALLGAVPALADWLPTTVPTQKEITAAESLWFRCFVRVPDHMTKGAVKDIHRDSIYVSLGGIRSPFVVWLNGQKIGEGDNLPGDQRRRFKVPKGILETKAFNVLAIQLKGKGVAAGLTSSPIIAGYFDEQELAGAWEMQREQPTPEELKAVQQQPATAAYTEAGFHPASTPLSANAELVRGATLPPAESLAKMQTPNDLKVELMLSEPLVAQPTQVSFDERGRMWVAQYRQYPFPSGLRMISRDKYYRARFDRVPPAPPNNDRGNDVISVHEDTDGDGTFDSHKVVLDGLNMANSAVRGHGGIWVMNSPYLLFYPDANGDDVPDGAPEVRLSGFGLEDTHSVANGLVWGPDGWLYGGQGSTVTSRVVRPGVDPEGFAGVYHEGCMVWRYHPQTKAYEIFAEGGGNVFGLDFDSQGRLHSGHNGGNTRGWYFVQGGLYLKASVDPGKYGPPPHAYAFGYLDMLKSRNPIARFSHATIIADGTALPERYAGRFFAGDPLHRNVMVAERYSRGSTFETSDVETALEGADPAFRPVYLTNAPDGAVYVADFYEEFIAHGQNYQGQINPDTGRIYRIRGKESALNKDVDLTKKTTAQLLDLLAHPNRWHRHTAVRVLGEKRDPAAIEPLRKLLSSEAEHPALEALWALHQMEALDEATALSALGHPQAPVRTWAIRLMGDAKKLPEQFAAAVVRLLPSEPDAEVRAQIASTSRRLPSSQGLPLVAALLKRDADAEDSFIPQLCWWTLESRCANERDAVIASLTWDSSLVKKEILPRIMRRFAAAGGRADLLTCARLLEVAPSAEHRQLLMTGFEEAFKGRALPTLPEPLVKALAESGLASRHLRVRLREPEAIAEALKIAADEKAKLDERLLCVRLFGEVKLPETTQTLLRLAVTAKATELRKAALTSLLIYEEPAIGEEVARGYSSLPEDVQPAAQTLLTSRPGWCVAFLNLIESGVVQASTVPPTTAALLREHADKTVSALARNVFATSSPSSKPQHQAEAQRVRRILAAAPGDPYRGEALFMQRCSACHALFHKGGRIGPDLTAYQRDDLGTLLTSVLDPNAEIREGFVNQLVMTNDNRTLSGFVVDQDASVVVLRGLDGQDVSIPRSEVREMRRAPASLMPEGLLRGLSDQELRDFFAYLRIPQPISR